MNQRTEHNETLANPLWQEPMVQVGGGRLAFEDEHWFSEREPPRLKLVLVLAGAITYQLGAQRPQRLRGPFLHLSLRQDECTVLHGMDRGEQLSYVSASVPVPALQHGLGVDVGQLMDRFTGMGERDAGSDSLQFNGSATQAQQYIARQILACPFEGAARQLYLGGKGLELLATSLPVQQGETAARQIDMDARTLAQLERARQILSTDLMQPLGLRELAREVGLNVNKLGHGFRRLHGCTVYEWLREQRMQHAHSLLQSGRMDVTQVAELCGYSLSHFSKLFRQRFDVLPSALHGQG